MVERVTEFQNRIADTLTAIIASGATESSVLDLGGCSISGIMMPAAFTGTTLTLKACDTAGGTFLPVYNTSGTQISFTVAANRFIGFSPSDLAAIKYAIIVSGSTEGGDRQIKVIPRSIA